MNAATSYLRRHAGPLVRDTFKRVAGQAAVQLSSQLGEPRSHRAGILVYHRTWPRTTRRPAPTMNVTPGRFRQQIEGLLQQGYRFWSLEQLVEAGSDPEATIPLRTIALTFDDGFANLALVMPVLRRYQIPATVFLPTAYLGDTEPFPFDPWAHAHQTQLPRDAYRSLDRDECLALHAEGLVRFGAHTHTHADFRQHPQRFADDLQRSLEIVGQLFQNAPVPFAFPFGKPSLGFVTSAMLDAVRDSGASCALTTEDRAIEPGQDPFGWGRFNVYQWDTPATLAAKLGGWYSWAGQLQTAWHRRRRHASHAVPENGVGIGEPIGSAAGGPWLR